MSAAENTWLSRFDRLSALAGEPLFTLGTSHVTPLRVIGFFSLLLLIAWLSSQVERGLQRVAARRPGLDRSTFYALSRMLRYVLWVVGSLLALHLVGVDLSAVALLTGAIGIGIGLGMQGLFNNVISGIFLLGEKALRVGDVISVDGGAVGTIRNIRLRHTLVLSPDGGHVMVPNSELVLKQVTHWTLTQAQRRLHVPFRVSRQADREQVRLAALAAAHAVTDTLDEGQQTPEVWMTDLGADAQSYELVVWVGRGAIERPARARAAYLSALARELDARGVALPPPSQALQLPDDALNIRVQRTPHFPPSG